MDKFGRPVYIELVGKHQCDKLIKVTTEKRLLDYHIYTWERFHKQVGKRRGMRLHSKGREGPW